MKSTFRNEILIKLNSISPDEKKRQAELIQNTLATVLKNESGTWVAYKSLKDEPEIKWNEVSSRIEWAFPRIENGALEFRKSVQIFTQSTLGFSEPSDGSVIDLHQINGFIIPGLSFDGQGHRLGRGLGFYDRALAEYKGQKIGVCFNVSMCEELPHERHDITCNQIVTENKVYKVFKSEGVGTWS